MLKSIFPSIHYPWEIKSHSIELLLSIMGGSDPKVSYNSSIDFASFIPSIFAVLKGVERIIICAPDTSSRKRTFGAFRKVLSNLPSSERFDMLKALLTNNGSPSMMALLIDLGKEEIHDESRHKNVSRVDETTKGHNNNEGSLCSQLVFILILESSDKMQTQVPSPEADNGADGVLCQECGQVGHTFSQHDICIIAQPDMP